MRSSLACVALLLAACSSPKGIELTLRFDPSVDDATLATVTQLVVHATGDESGDYPIPLDRPAQRTERLLYDPSATTKHLALSATALAAGSTAVASSALYSLTAGRGASATLLLVTTNDQPPDGGSPQDGSAGADLAGADLAGADLASTPDMTVLHDAPVFVGSSQVQLGEYQSADLVAPLPAAATAGMLLIAVATSEQYSTEPVSITPPSGWNTIGTETASPGGTDSIAGFYWHIAQAGETTYSFAHGGIEQSSLTLVAYSGQSSGATPFDAAIASGPHASATTLPFDAVTSTFEPDLRIALAVSPNRLNVTYTAPTGMTLRASTLALVADAPITTVGVAPATTGGANASVITVTLSALVRGQ